MLPAMRRKSAQRNIVLLAVAACVAKLCTEIACTPDGAEAGAAGPHPTASLLAAGDTGHPWGVLPQIFEGQLAVGAAMQREHARAPVDALVLLGDNFYPGGLLVDELLPRIAENVAKPYCAFIDPSAALAEFLGNACSGARRIPPRLFAVIGNHDLISPGSRDLQRRAVPRFVRNWDMPSEDGPALRDLPGGLSLILLDTSRPWGEVGVRELASALRRARGPWRVIVGHRPPIAGHPQLSKMVARAADESERVVHAYLAGHVHVLAAIRGVAPAPALTVIAGSGSRAQRQDTTEYRIDAADMILERLGFVRVDLLAERVPPRLRITLFSAPPSAALAFLGSTSVACYEIALDGSVPFPVDRQNIPDE